jgi:hypothetical protein
MKQVDAFLMNLFPADPLEQMNNFLRSRDPEFAALETTDSTALAEPHREQLVTGLLYAFRQGLLLNLENFRSPLGGLLLTRDHALLVREHILHSLSAYPTFDAPSDSATAEYYIYMETVGLKVAHYLGFRLGDLWYPMTEPGYVADAVATFTYRMELERYLGFTLG